MTAVTSDENAARRNNWILEQRTDYDEMHNADAEKFVDPDFPPSVETIGDAKVLGTKELCWVRGVQLNAGFGHALLYDRVEPCDVVQGAIGNCWLMCAIAAVAEFPHFIKENVINEKSITSDGKYSVNLYNCGFGKWEKIVIDDYIPCQRAQWFEHPAPLFAQPKGHELYVLLLEKAFAKFAGGYSELDGGHALAAWLVLTGCEDLEIWRINHSKGVAEGNVSFLVFHCNSSSL